MIALCFSSHFVKKCKRRNSQQFRCENSHATSLHLVRKVLRVHKPTLWRSCRCWWLENQALEAKRWLPQGTRSEPGQLRMLMSLSSKRKHRLISTGFVKFYYFSKHQWVYTVKKQNVIKRGGHTKSNTSTLSVMLGLGLRPPNMALA